MAVISLNIQGFESVIKNIKGTEKEIETAINISLEIFDPVGVRTAPAQS